MHRAELGWLMDQCPGLGPCWNKQPSWLLGRERSRLALLSKDMLKTVLEAKNS